MMKEKFREYKVYFFNVMWPDSVWSKVIAGIILAVLGAIGTLLYALSKSIIENVSFKQGLKDLLIHLSEKRSLTLNNFILYCLILLLTYVIFKFLLTFSQDIILKIRLNKPILNKTENKIEGKKPRITDSSTAFFTYRLAKAFPGQRGLTWYDDPKTIINRLNILLKEPLLFQGMEDCPGDPIWWFRGGSSMYITAFKSLSKTKGLMDIDELEIKRIAVNIDRMYYKSYIYVETKAEKQTGLYNIGSEQIKDYIKTFGYAWEEYGLVGKIPIKREEYDDGAALIKGKIVTTESAELRSRYLSDYNFLIAAKQSPYTSQKFSHDSKRYFDGILSDTVSHVDFFNYLDAFEKHTR